MSTEPNNTHIENAAMLSRVLGTKWTYKTDRALYESEPMPTEITFRINQWLEPLGILTEGRTGLEIPNRKTVLSISDRQPLVNLPVHRDVSLYDTFARQLGLPLYGDRTPA